uniref:Uncharacterized protein n=1 Tax=Candidozyma auris TaxID=498019 RepID=A0A0L0NPN6_CANAR
MVLIALYEPKRTAELAPCLKETGTTPAYIPLKPKSLTNLTVPESNPFWYLGLAVCLSSIKAVLIASNGVTATTDSNNPAPKPARTPRGPESLPFLSAKSALMESNPRKRTEALAVLPTMKAGHPMYKAPTPWVLATFAIKTNGFLDAVEDLLTSCSLVLANSKG